MSLVAGRVDEIDVQMDRIHRLVDGAMLKDPELAIGAATTQSLGGLGRQIDQALASVLDLESDLKARIRAGNGR